MAASLSSAVFVVSVPSLKAKKGRHLGSFSSPNSFHCSPLSSSRFLSRYFSLFGLYIVCLVAEKKVRNGKFLEFEFAFSLFVG